MMEVFLYPNIFVKKLFVAAIARDVLTSKAILNSATRTKDEIH